MIRLPQDVDELVTSCNHVRASASRAGQMDVSARLESNKNIEELTRYKLTSNLARALHTGNV